MFKTRVVLLGALLLVGCTMRSEARTPNPNVLGERKSRGTVTLDVSRVPEDELCSQQGGLRDFCVTNFRSAIGSGLQRLLPLYIDSSQPGPTYTAIFRLIEFSHSMTSSSGLVGSNLKVTLRWQFELRAPSGEPIVQLAETTDGPEQFTSTSATDRVIYVLLNSVMETVAKAIKTSSTWPTQTDAPR
ncbi:MAG: hypothetical protein ACOY0T_38235 [Myxococcota bacterium]